MSNKWEFTFKSFKASSTSCYQEIVQLKYGKVFPSAIHYAKHWKSEQSDSFLPHFNYQNIFQALDYAQLIETIMSLSRKRTVILFNGIFPHICICKAAAWSNYLLYLVNDP